ncbi:hypothetical protein CHS0354_018375 [Potamilus streckersoni]|uniref:Uncharacterized protein n=1 Tax=Potamilus streckersoni TaxID=2493646 RepID=A0AAE0W9V4_9BIVA|nr:hypothetical protein CHS0354_018375 [Potamilus streckersoni]
MPGILSAKTIQQKISGITRSEENSEFTAPLTACCSQYPCTHRKKGSPPNTVCIPVKLTRWIIPQVKKRFTSDWGLAAGTIRRRIIFFAGNSGKYKVTNNTLGYGFNWAPTDNFYLSVSSFAEAINVTGKSDVANGGTLELKKDLDGLGYIQLQLAAKTDFLGGGLKLRSNSSVSELKWERIDTDGEATNRSQKAKANYTDYELYINTQFHPMISAGLAYSPAVSAKDTFEVTPSPTSASYHLAGHGTQTKLHALLAPIDILGIRLDYNKEAENKSSNDAAETETKLSGYVILGPGILGIDYSSVKRDEYILSAADAVDGKASQKEYTATTTGIEYQMAATENIHLDFRYDSYKKTQRN